MEKKQYQTYSEFQKEKQRVNKIVRRLGFIALLIIVSLVVYLIYQIGDLAMMEHELEKLNQMVSY
jgi:hypothetical protein